MKVGGRIRLSRTWVDRLIDHVKEWALLWGLCAAVLVMGIVFYNAAEGHESIKAKPEVLRSLGTVLGCGQPPPEVMELDEYLAEFSAGHVEIRLRIGEDGELECGGRKYIHKHEEEQT